MTVHVAVVGTGFAERTQIPALLLHPEVKVVAIVSRQLHRARSVAERYGIDHAFDRYEDLWKIDALDAVSIVTPPKLHASMALDALQHGCHVLCEKPMAMNLGEADQMLSAANRAQKVHAIDHEFRYTLARAYLKYLVSAGELGAIHTIRMTQYRDMWHNPKLPWNWLFDEEQGGGLFGAMGSHLIDMLLHTFGPVTAVSALLGAGVGQRQAENSENAVEVTADDTLSLLLQMESGPQCVLQLTGISSQNRPLEVEVHGEKAAYLMRGNDRLYQINGGNLEEVHIPQDFRQKLEPFSDNLNESQRGLQPFLALVEDWLQAMSGKPSERLPSFADGRAVQAVMDAARKSSRNGQFIKLS